MEKRRCIFCMKEMDAEEKRCPFCKKALWEYEWESRWLKPYTVLKERYMLGRVLGEGAFAATYLAYDQEEDSPAAVKAYFGKELSEEEAILEKTGDIPGVVRKTDFFQEKGNYYLVLQYLEGGSLKEYLKKHHSVPAETAARMLQPVMEALVFLHSRGILHGDVSPDNLLFDGNGSLKLIDFGAAFRKGGQRTEKELKEGYAPMEQYQEREKAGPWTDIYALCAVWYEMTTGHKVPPAPERAGKDNLKGPGAYVRVPEKMEQIFMRGLSVDIQGRYFSMENLMALLGISGSWGEPEKENIREIWGDLWITITTRVEREAASDKKKGRLRRALKAAAGIFAGFGAAAALFAGGLGIYGDIYPERILAYELKKDREEADNLERKIIRTRDSEEFEEAVGFLEKNAYKYEKSEYSSTYHFSAEALEGWEYPGTDDSNLPVRPDTVKRAMELFSGEKGKKEDRSFSGYVTVYEDQEENPLSVHLSWTDFCYYGKDRIWIESDYVTGFTESVMLLSPDRDRISDFFFEMLPVISPESFLKEEEIQELLSAAEKTGEYISISLNARCRVSIRRDDTGYTAVIYGD